MATKSRLETVFTGDDRQFQKTAARIQSTGRKMEAMGGRLKSSLMGLGAGMLVGSTLQKFDRIGKLATKFKISTNALQRLGHVANLGGADLETVAKAMATLNKNTDQARRGVKTYTFEFEKLGINAEEFAALGHEEQFFVLSDAIKAATDRSSAMAAAQVLMGRSGGEMFAIMEQGSGTLRDQMKEVAVASESSVRSIEILNDNLSRIKTTGLSKLADILGAVADFFQSWGEGIGHELARFTAGFADMVKMMQAGGGSFMIPDALEDWAKEQPSSVEVQKAINKFKADKEAAKTAKPEEPPPAPKPVAKMAMTGGMFPPVRQFTEYMQAILAKRNDIIAPQGKLNAGDLAEILHGKKPAAVAAMEAVRQQVNAFDPRRAGGFFSQAGRTGLARHATKSLEQKMKDLAQKTFNENQTTNQLLRDALL